MPVYEYICGIAMIRMSWALDVALTADQRLSARDYARTSISRGHCWYASQ